MVLLGLLYSNRAFPNFYIGMYTMAELFIWQKFCMIKCSGQETWDRGLGLGARNKNVGLGLRDANTHSV